MHEHQRIVNELYRHQQSPRTVNKEDLEAVIDKMRGIAKEDHIRIMKNQMNALKKAKKRASKGTRPVNLSTSVNKKEMLKNMAYYEHVGLHSLVKTPPHKRNLNLLRNTIDLQCTLQKDDLWWD